MCDLLDLMEGRPNTGSIQDIFVGDALKPLVSPFCTPESSCEACFIHSRLTEHATHVLVMQLPPEQEVSHKQDMLLCRPSLRFNIPLYALPPSTILHHSCS